jgi:hypothetical protein
LEAKFVPGEMQGGQKYGMLGMAHSQAAMQYSARAAALRKVGNAQHAAKHVKIGGLHKKAGVILSQIAKAHEKHTETGMQSQLAAIKEKGQQMAKEDVDVLDEGKTFRGDDEANKKNKWKERSFKRQKKSSDGEQVDEDVTVDEALDDLLTSALERRPVDFQSVMNELVLDRVAEKVDDLKLAIAQETFTETEVEA